MDQYKQEKPSNVKEYNFKTKENPKIGVKFTKSALNSLNSPIFLP